MADRTRTRSSSSLGAEMLELIQKEMSNFLKSTVFKETLKAAVNDAFKEVELSITQPLKEEIAALKRELSSVKEHANQNEQYSRRSNIRIFGIDETTDEICHDVVKEFFSNDLGVEINPRDIDRVHRVGRRRTDGTARPIIVKFNSHNAKVAVMKKKRDLRGRQIYINEDLTKSNQDLLKASRSALRERFWVYTVDGTILTKNKNDNIIRRIQKAEDLVVFNQPAST